MTRRLATAGAAAICLLVTGCGNSSPRLSTGAGNTLRADVLALTQAAAAHQWSAADQALAQLRTDLTAAISTGAVTAAQAQTIHADVDKVAADLAAHRVAVTPKTSSSSSTAAKPAPHPKPPKPPKKPKPHPGHHDGHGPGHRPGHGPGHDH
jgi:hypothetical protein